MKLIYKGKTKDVFEREDGNLEFHFKDAATGYMTPKGPVFDSGYDDVVGEILGKDVISCQFTKYFFELLTEMNVPNHYIESPPHSNIMIVKPAILLGAKNTAEDFAGSSSIYNLEWVFRNEVFGSFWRRYPCMRPGNKLSLVEIYAKGRAGEPDILLVDDALAEMGIMSYKEAKITKARTKVVCDLMYEQFAKRNLHLIDGKMEWGRDIKTGEIILIDDLSPDTFKVCEGFLLDENGNCLKNRECIKTEYKNDKRTMGAKNILNADQEGLLKLASAFELEI